MIRTGISNREVDMTTKRRLRKLVETDPDSWFHLNYNRREKGKVYFEVLIANGVSGNFEPDPKSDSYRGLVKATLRELGYKFVF